MRFEKPRVKHATKIICVGFILFLLGIYQVSAQEIPYINISYAANKAEDNDITTKTYFDLVPAINYSNRFWVVRSKDLKHVGYATWNDITRRYTLFNFRDEYRGFIQATIGQQFTKGTHKDKSPHYYTQYLWYLPDNRYRMFSVIRLGGRPQEDNLPYGELGGNLMNFPEGNMAGNVPLRPHEIFSAIEPLKGPMGIDISVIYRLPTIIHR